MRKPKTTVLPAGNPDSMPAIGLPLPIRVIPDWEAVGAHVKMYGPTLYSTIGFNKNSGHACLRPHGLGVYDVMIDGLVKAYSVEPIRSRTRVRADRPRKTVRECILETLPIGQSETRKNLYRELTGRGYLQGVIACTICRMKIKNELQEIDKRLMRNPSAFIEERSIGSADTDLVPA
jgi:hypothetical protein